MEIIREMQFFEPGNERNQAIQRVDKMTPDQIEHLRYLQREFYNRTEFVYLPPREVGERREK